MENSYLKELSRIIKDIQSSKGIKDPVVSNGLSFCIINKNDTFSIGPNSLEICGFPYLLVSKPFRWDDDEDDEDNMSRSAPTSGTPKKNLFQLSAKLGPSFSESSNVEGSPLKLQTYADFTEIDSPSSDYIRVPRCRKKMPKDIGIPVSKAKAVMSAFNVVSKEFYQSGSQEINFKYMIILCDGADSQRTACLREEPIFEMDENYLGMKISKTTVKDSCCSEEKSCPPQLDKLSTYGYDVECEASYNVLGDVEVDLSDAEYQASLLLIVKWNHLSSIPPGDARSVIRASITSGDMKSAAYQLYEQLNSVKTFIQGLSTGFVDWKSEKREKTGIQIVSELVEELKLGDAPVTKPQVKEENTEEIGNVLDSFMFQDRLDLDFTDRLWNVYSNFSSYSELLEGMNLIFKELNSGDLHPMVRRSNQTTMAQMVREANTGRLRLPNLAGLYALQLLAEIGVEKLHKDYAFIFLSKNLVTLSNLEFYLKPNEDLACKFKLLEKMHHVLEMIALLKLMLQIPNITLGSIAREMLKYYETADIDMKKQFTFNIPTSLIEHMFDVKAPCDHQVTLSKMVGDAKESTTHLLTFSQPYFHLPVKKDILLDPDEQEEKEKPYFYVKNKEVVSLIWA